VSRHAGRIVAITGAAGGIGQAIVRRLAGEGARVAIADVADASETVELARQAGGEAAGFKVDIAQWEQRCAFAAAVRARFGEPAIPIHCAALQFMSPFEELNSERWRATHDVNLVPAQFVGGPHKPHISLSRNGRVMQDEGTGDMIFDCARLIEALSRFMALQPGDLICTGSSSGNGMHHGVLLKPGDVMEGSISGPLESLATQRNHCHAETESR
jgi:NAD(P)-dependent dehydrogenase (short-subunit alcohol dehydrogenase family)